MIALMHDAQGVGLAATQVGVLRRLFVFEPDDDGPRAIVNPTIVERGEETTSDEEGCLSLQGVRVPVERTTKLTLEGKDPNGEDVRYELEGYGARIVQHELDHLDGVLIIDRTDDEHRKEALSTLRPRVVAAADASASRRPRRSAPTSSSGSPSGTRSRGCSRAPTRRSGRGRELSPPPAKLVASGSGSRCTSRRSRSCPRPSTRVVVCAYGLYIPPRLLETSLWLNVHPSLLPRWRGAAPVERAILAGDEETGVTIHETVAALDAGPIAAREAFPVGELDAGQVFANSGGGRGAAARRGDRVAVVRAAGRRRRHLRGEDRAGRPRAEPRRPASTPGGASARCRRTSAPGRRCTAGASRSGRRGSRTGSFVPEVVQPEGRSQMGYDEFLRGAAVIAPARRAAFDVVRRVFEEDAYADRALGSRGRGPRRA